MLVNIWPAALLVEVRLGVLLVMRCMPGSRAQSAMGEMTCRQEPKETSAAKSGAARGQSCLLLSLAPGWNLSMSDVKALESRELRGGDDLESSVWSRSSAEAGWVTVLAATGTNGASNFDLADRAISLKPASFMQLETWCSVCLKPWTGTCAPLTSWCYLATQQITGKGAGEGRETEGGREMDLDGERGHTILEELYWQGFCCHWKRCRGSSWSDAISPQPTLPSALVALVLRARGCNLLGGNTLPWRLSLEAEDMRIITRKAESEGRLLSFAFCLTREGRSMTSLAVEVRGTSMRHSGWRLLPQEDKVVELEWEE